MVYFTITGDIVENTHHVKSKDILLVKGNRWQLYQKLGNRYERVQSPIEFIFVDKKRNISAVINNKDIILVPLIRGKRGCRGYPGIPGTSGSPGSQGISGSPGSQGISGSPGSQGISGSPGASGFSGKPGLQGVSGPPGSEGISGVPGLSGVPGYSGGPGNPGVSGPPGSQGISGSPGNPGISGPRGSQGISGSPGAPGLPGSSGAPGFSGAPGPSGTPGSSGAPGPSGGPGSSDIFGSLYNSVLLAMSGISGETNPPQSDQIITFSDIGPLSGITASHTALTLPVDGTYEATYTVTALSGSPYYSIRLVNNRGGSLTMVPNSGFLSLDPEITGNVQFTAHAGDQISLANNGPVLNLFTIPITLVTHGTNQSTTTPVVSPSLIIPTSVSNSVYVAVQLYSNAASQIIHGVTDSLGNTYTLVELGLPVFGQMAIFYCDNVQTNISFTVSCSFDVGTGVTDNRCYIEVIGLINTATPSLISYTITDMSSELPPYGVTINQTMGQGIFLTVGLANLEPAGTTIELADGTVPILDPQFFSLTTLGRTISLSGADSFTIAPTTANNVLINFSTDYSGIPFDPLETAIEATIAPLMYANNASLTIKLI